MRRRAPKRRYTQRPRSASYVRRRKIFRRTGILTDDTDHVIHMGMPSTPLTKMALNPGNAVSHNKLPAIDKSILATTQPGLIPTMNTEQWEAAKAAYANRPIGERLYDWLSTNDGNPARTLAIGTLALAAAPLFGGASLLRIGAQFGARMLGIGTRAIARPVLGSASNAFRNAAYSTSPSRTYLSNIGSPSNLFSATTRHVVRSPTQIASRVVPRIRSPSVSSKPVRTLRFPRLRGVSKTRNPTPSRLQAGGGSISPSSYTSPISRARKVYSPDPVFPDLGPLSPIRFAARTRYGRITQRHASPNFRQYSNQYSRVKVFKKRRYVPKKIVF